MSKQALLNGKFNKVMLQTDKGGLETSVWFMNRVDN